MPIIERPPNRGIGRFLGTPEVEYLSGGSLVRLLADFVYEGPDAKRWVAPKGMVSDGASIPRCLWTLIGSPMSGPHFFAGLIHDARYRLGDCTKAEADMVMWDACLCGGTSEADALAIAEGLAAGGEAAWEANAAKRQRAKSIAELLEMV